MIIIRSLQTEQEAQLSLRRADRTQVSESQ